MKQIENDENTPKKMLEIKHLRTSFFTDAGEVKAVDDVSYHVNEKEIVAVVGESGSGKSVTLLSVLQLVQCPPGKILGGEIIFDGRDLLKCSTREMRKVRGDGISMIFQEPMTSLNPVYTVGNQLAEVLRTHNKKLSRKEAWDRGIEALEAVGIPDPGARMENYPFEMSGGMRQRVMIALAVACRSRLILADEPTTALDVTTQAQVMELLTSLVHKMETSLVVVTHNLGLVSRYADRTNIMYAGKIVETGTTETILTNPRHPYTRGLLKSVPRLDMGRDEVLVPIKGTPPKLADLPDYCAFYDRCIYACETCRTKPYPALQAVDGDSSHLAACHLKIGGDDNGKKG